MNSLFKLFFLLLVITMTSPANAQNRRDPVPTAPTLDVPESGIVSQAGAGNDIGYARAGVLELGGSASFTRARGLTEFGFAPSLGYFFMDNWEASTSLNWTYVKADGDGNHVLMLLVEPSFHYPTSNQDFIFMGLGLGLAYQSAGDGSGGFAFAPRVGYKRLVGRSGVLTADLRVVYSTADVVQTPRGTALTVDGAATLGLGFAVMW